MRKRSFFRKLFTIKFGLIEINRIFVSTNTGSPVAH